MTHGWKKVVAIVPMPLLAAVAGLTGEARSEEGTNQPCARFEHRGFSEKEWGAVAKVLPASSVACYDATLGRPTLFVDAKGRLADNLKAYVTAFTAAHFVKVGEGPIPNGRSFVFARGSERYAVWLGETNAEATRGLTTVMIFRAGAD
jgi:hypothetical protein